MCAEELSAAPPYELVIFDWDGTLRDSIGTIVGCAQAALGDLELAADSAVIRSTVGTSLATSIPRWVPGIEPELARAVEERYRVRWIEEWNDRADFFPGVPEMLGDLAARGLLLAVATGKGRRGLRVDLERSDAAHRFAATRTADDCAAKPAPQMVHEILDELGVKPSRTLVVGDTTHDLLMARNAEVDAVATLRGAMTRDELEPHALAVLPCATDLPDWLAAPARCATDRST